MHALLLGFWILHIGTRICRSSPSGDRTIREDVPDSRIACSNKVDVVFVLDSSSSIWAPDFRKQIRFVNDTIQDLCSGSDAIRCALLTYADYARVEFGLQATQGTAFAKGAVAKVRQLRGNTRTDLALRRLRVLLEEEGRPEVPQVGVVVTDGQSHLQAATAREARVVRGGGIGLFAVGVGDDLDERELRAIASGPEFLFLRSTEQLTRDLRRVLTEKICSQTEETEKPSPPDVCRSVTLDLTFLLDLSIAHYPDNLKLSQRFVRNCVSALTVANGDAVHASVVTYGDAPRVQFELATNGGNVTSLLRAISHIAATANEDSVTELSGALRILGSSERHYRPGASRAVVVVTGGRVGDPSVAAAAAAAADLKADGRTKVFVVGVGSGIDRRELESVASAPFRRFGFLVAGYRNLGSVVLELLERICETSTTADNRPQRSSTVRDPSSTATSVTSPGKRRSQTTTGPSSTRRTVPVATTREPEVTVTSDSVADDVTSARISTGFQQATTATESYETTESNTSNDNDNWPSSESVIEIPPPV